MANRRSSAKRAALRRIRSVPAVNRATSNIAVRLARKSARLASALELHGIREGEIPVELPNGRTLVLWSADGDVFASQLWWHGWDSYEPDSVRPWFRLAREARTVLDVGANQGFFALLAGLANPQAHVYAFEPMPTTRETLERNIRSNPAAQVVPVPAAAGVANGTTEIFWNPTQRHDFTASVDPGRQSSRAGMTSETVPVVALDEWAKSSSVNYVDLVKIDVEGHEPEVLSGMRSILGQRPDVLVEILDERTAAAVREVVNERGYSHYLLTPVGPIKTDLIAPHVCLNHLLTARDDQAVQALLYPPS